MPSTPSRQASPSPIGTFPANRRAHTRVVETQVAVRGKHGPVPDLLDVTGLEAHHISDRSLVVSATGQGSLRPPSVRWSALARHRSRPNPRDRKREVEGCPVRNPRLPDSD